MLYYSILWILFVPPYRTRTYGWCVVTCIWWWLPHWWKVDRLVQHNLTTQCGTQCLQSCNVWSIKTIIWNNCYLCILEDITYSGHRRLLNYIFLRGFTNGEKDLVSLHVNLTASILPYLSKITALFTVYTAKLDVDTILLRKEKTAFYITWIP